MPSANDSQPASCPVAACLLPSVHIPRRWWGRTWLRMEPSGSLQHTSFHIVSDPFISSWSRSTCYKSTLFNWDVDTFHMCNHERSCHMSCRRTTAKGRRGQYFPERKPSALPGSAGLFYLGSHLSRSSASFLSSQHLLASPPASLPAPFGFTVIAYPG